MDLEEEGNILSHQHVHGSVRCEKIGVVDTGSCYEKECGKLL